MSKLNKEQASKYISECLSDMRDKMLELEEMADEHGLTFEYHETYYGKGLGLPNDLGISQGEWVSSSDLC